MPDPVSWLVVKRGWKVLAADGEEVGRVDEVLADEQRDIFSGITFTHGLLGRPRYVPAERVAGIVEGELRLDLTRPEIEALGERSSGTA